MGIHSKRCASCHGRDLGRSQYPQDSAIINLTNPENSRALTAHLAREAGGFGLDAPKNGEKPPCFQGKADATYQAILQAIRHGRRDMLADPRMDIPGATPRPGHNDWGRFRGTGPVDEKPPGKFLDEGPRGVPAP